MRAIVINAKGCDIHEVEFELEDELKTIYREVGCDGFCSGGHFRGPDGTLYMVTVDDDGHLKDREEGFQFSGLQPLCGNGIILGTNPYTGETVTCTLDIEWVREHVRWFEWNETNRPDLSPTVIVWDS